MHTHTHTYICMYVYIYNVWIKKWYSIVIVTFIINNKTYFCNIKGRKEIQTRVNIKSSQKLMSQ